MPDPFRLQREGICRRIAQAREAAGLTHIGLAQNLTACSGARVSARDVRRFEKSRVPWAILDELARVTGTSSDWLVHGDTRPHDAPEPLWERSLFEPRQPEQEPGAARRERPTAARAGLGLLLGLVVAIAVERLTHSVPTAVLALLAIFGVALLRQPRGRFFSGS